MSEYRFHLEKYRYGSKTDCPGCGRERCFVRYIDGQGTIHFPSSVGKCDHEQSCGYHYTPHEYFRDNPEAMSDDDCRIERIFRHSVIHTRPYRSNPLIYPKRLSAPPCRTMIRTRCIGISVACLGRRRPCGCSIATVSAHRQSGAACPRRRSAQAFETI